jgi:hypothetical protein
MLALVRWLQSKWRDLLSEEEEPVVIGKPGFRLFVDGKEVPIVSAKVDITHPSRPMKGCTYRDGEPTIIRCGKFEEKP